MTEEIFFDLFPYSFHDGDLKDPLWEGALTLSGQRRTGCF